MIDTAIIRENYANMLDSQLIAVARHDGHQLSSEAFQLLKQEFIKRDLDISHIELAEENKAQIKQEEIQKFRDSNTDDFLRAIWKYAIDEKENDRPDSGIVAGLQERGLEEADAIAIVSGIEIKLKETIDGYDTKMLVGAAAFFIGIFITLLSYSSAKVSGGTYIITWGAILFGAVRFFSSLSEKAKYKRLLAKIQKGSRSLHS